MGHVLSKTVCVWGVTNVIALQRYLLYVHEYSRNKTLGEGKRLL